jgi:DNA polymerase III gamma/tau subunit
VAQGELYRLVRKIHKIEGGALDRETLEMIAASANGSARDALVLLEQVIGLEDPKRVKEVIALGITEEGMAATIDLCRALISPKASWPRVAKILSDLKGGDPEKIRRAVLGYMQSVLLGGKRNDRAAVAIEMFSEPTYNTGFPGLTLSAYQTMFDSSE